MRSGSGVGGMECDYYSLIIIEEPKSRIKPVGSGANIEKKSSQGRGTALGNEPDGGGSSHHKHWED